MKNRGARKLAIGIALAGALALVPNLAGADGTQTPVGAPTVKVGAVNFGNTKSSSTGSARDYYRLPALLAGDVVTVAARTDSDSHQFCLAADVDGFNWSQEECNLAKYDYVGKDGKRMKFTATRATNNAFLLVRKSYSSGNGGYEFTVERIQKKVGLSVIVGTQVSANGTVQVQARRSDGRSPGNGHLLKLVARVNGSNYYYAANVQGDRATFKLSLPSSAVGDYVTLTASSPETAVFAPSSSVPTSLKVVK